jgi:23S rRNA (uracil1939-C5)-methyltransferase
MTDRLSAGPVSIEIVDFAMPRDLGVGRWENRVVFVPGAVPGDRVRVELAREGKGFAYGRMIDLEEPSPWRRDPSCPHFGSCGGCSLLHFDYEQQLEIKARHLAQTLRRVGGLQVDSGIIAPVTPSADRLFYRGKIELAYNRQGGENLLGLKKRLSPFEPYTGDVIPIESCAIFSPVLEGILPVLRDFFKEHNLSAFDERTKRGFLKGITIRESKTTGEVMVILETSKEQLHGIGSLVTSLQQSVPAVRSVGRLHDARVETLAGPGWIEETIDDLRFRIGPAVFFQPNPNAARLLYRKVVDFARSLEARRVVGLYCGMGPLEMVLSRAVEAVEGYDADPENIGNARHNCKTNRLSNCRFHAKRIEDLPVENEPFDLAVVDPPRTGMSKTALQSLLGLNLPALAYISCDPATLARDLKTLVAAGFTLIQAMPFDFFPHTSHLETLVLLQRK